MKFLLDVCVSSRTLTEFLSGQGHDVVSALDLDPRASDVAIMGFALNDDRILITEDKDFGEMIFARREAHGPIVRTIELKVDEQVRAIEELLAKHAHALDGQVIVTISRGRIRIRRRDG